MRNGLEPQNRKRKKCLQRSEIFRTNIWPSNNSENTTRRTEAKIVKCDASTNVTLSLEDADKENNEDFHDASDQWLAEVSLENVNSKSNLQTKDNNQTKDAVAQMLASAPAIPIDDTQPIPSTSETIVADVHVVPAALKTLELETTQQSASKTTEDLQEASVPRAPDADITVIKETDNTKNCVPRLARRASTGSVIGVKSKIKPFSLPNRDGTRPKTIRNVANKNDSVKPKSKTDQNTKEKAKNDEKRTLRSQSKTNQEPRNSNQKLLTDYSNKET